jgi:hypothetical protein
MDHLVNSCVVRLSSGYQQKQIKKEIPYVVDYCCNPNRSVVARIFRAQYQSEFSKNRQLDSRSGGNRCSAHYIELAWGGVKPRLFLCVEPVGEAV